MSRVMLVRHGQAQTGAVDEASYDRLSALGEKQADWLGQYLAGTHHRINRVISGTMRRQRQTAARVASALGMAPQEDDRLNEINYFALAASMQERHAVDAPTDRAGFLVHFPQVMAAWKNGAIENPDECFADYEARVHSILEEAELHDGTMLVTSGGIIGMAMRHILDLETNAFSHILLQTNNASMHRYEVEFGERRLVTFNATPHFDTPGREKARTFI